MSGKNILANQASNLAQNVLVVLPELNDREYRDAEEVEVLVAELVVERVCSNGG